MGTEFWEAVRQRAHALWLAEGCPEGRSDQHWQQAQRDALASAPAAPLAADQPEEAPSREAPACAPEATEVQPADAFEVSAAPVFADPATPVALQFTKGTSLFKIKARQCRYIVGETHSPTIFCGAPTDGGSWCREHNARVFVRSSPRPGAKAERRPGAR